MKRRFYLIENFDECFQPLIEGRPEEETEVVRSAIDLIKHMAASSSVVIADVQCVPEDVITHLADEIDHDLSFADMIGKSMRLPGQMDTWLNGIKSYLKAIREDCDLFTEEEIAGHRNDNKERYYLLESIDFDPELLVEDISDDVKRNNMLQGALHAKGIMKSGVKKIHGIDCVPEHMIVELTKGFDDTKLLQQDSWRQGIVLYLRSIINDCDLFTEPEIMELAEDINEFEKGIHYADDETNDDHMSHYYPFDEDGPQDWLEENVADKTEGSDMNHHLQDGLDGFVDAGSRKPEDCKPVEIYFTDKFGDKIIAYGMYIPKYTYEAAIVDGTEEDGSFDVKDGTIYLAEGWWSMPETDSGNAFRMEYNVHGWREIKPSLKPCPFCGGKAEIVEYTANREIGEKHYCGRCKTCGSTRKQNQHGYLTWTEAVKDWNTRWSF